MPNDLQSANRKEELKEKRVAKVVAVTGWDEETAYAAYRKAYKEHKIKFADYMKYKFYAIPEEEHAEKWDKIQKREALRKERVAKVVDKTGWDEKTAYAAYRKAYKEHKIKFADYMKYKFYAIPEEEHAEHWDKIQKKEVLRKERVAKVVDKTGWDEKTAYAAYRKAYKEHKIKFADYMKYKFYAIPEEEHAEKWDKICLKKARIQQEKAFLEIWKQADNKLTKQGICALFGVPFDGENEVYSGLQHGIFTTADCLAAIRSNSLKDDPSDPSVFSAAKEAMDLGAKRLLCTVPIPGYPCLTVPDTTVRRAVSRIIQILRKQYSFQAVAITGSYGKTTTTSFVYSILQLKHKAYGFDGKNDNTLPSLIQKFQGLPHDTDFFVQETSEAPTFGTPGRISSILKPQVSIVTNIGTSHLERIGSKERILESCLTIQKGMPKDGVLILNVDDVLLQQVETKRKVITYSTTNPNVDYFATNVRVSTQGIHFDIIHHDTVTPILIHCIGVHNVQNATAAFAAGCNLGLSPEECAEGLSTYRAEGIRQNLVNCNGYHFYLDCFNAAGESMKSAIDAIETIELSKEGRYIAVLADMKELGEISAQTHRSVGKYVAKSKIRVLLCLGEEAKLIAEEAKKNSDITVLCLNSHDEIVTYLEENLTLDDLVLLKGSHDMELSTVYQLFEDSVSSK